MPQDKEEISPSLGLSGSSLAPLLTYFINQSKIWTSQCTEISTSSHRWASVDRYSAKYFISWTSRSLGQWKSCFTEIVIQLQLVTAKKDYIIMMSYIFKTITCYQYWYMYRMNLEPIVCQVQEYRLYIDK